MNLRRLQYFVKIVDIGSLTQAADILHVAQPALSQQLATLEGEVRQQLLLRTKRGVTPTEAGRVLYQHAQLILRQCEQARVDMIAAHQGLSGAVSVGLAPGTAAAGLALPLLRAVRARHPGILLYLNETYGTTLSELIMNGRMDIAVLYGGNTSVHGLAFTPLLKEQLFLVGPVTMPALPAEVPLRLLGDIDLYLARPYNVVRRMVDEAFAGAGMAPRVVAEVESASTLTAVIAEGWGRPSCRNPWPGRSSPPAAPGRAASSTPSSPPPLRSASPTTCRSPNRRAPSATSCSNWSPDCRATSSRRHKPPLSGQRHSVLAPAGGGH